MSLALAMEVLKPLEEQQEYHSRALGTNCCSPKRQEFLKPLCQHHQIRIRRIWELTLQPVFMWSCKHHEA